MFAKISRPIIWNVSVTFHLRFYRGGPTVSSCIGFHSIELLNFRWPTKDVFWVLFLRTQKDAWTCTRGLIFVSLDIENPPNKVPQMFRPHFHGKQTIRSSSLFATRCPMNRWFGSLVWCWGPVAHGKQLPMEGGELVLMDSPNHLAWSKHQWMHGMFWQYQLLRSTDWR